MRDLGEIVDSARTGEKVLKEELIYAVIALSHLSVLDNSAFMALADAEINNKKPVKSYSAEWQAQERINRISRAYKKSPKEFIGKDYDPKIPANRGRLKKAKKLFRGE